MVETYMTCQADPVSDTQRFSIQTLFWIVAAVTVGLAPTAYFGWKGIVSTICLTIAGLLIVFGQKNAGLALVVLLSLGQFFHPAIDGAREAILRSDCQNSLRTLTYAMHDYESKHGHFPPPFTTNNDGEPLHSWRVLLLPFLGEQELYDQIDKSKPWDHSANLQFHERMNVVFSCAAATYHSRWRSTGNSTPYVAVVGRRTGWQPKAKVTFGMIVDGASRTIAIVESANHRIPWMSPADPTLNSLLGKLDFSNPHDGYLNASFFDGSVHLLSNDLGSDQITEMLLIDDGN